MAKVEAYFSDIRDRILTVLDSATDSIKVCMAWLTDKVLMDKLLEKLNDGFEVEICLLDHEFNKVKYPVQYGDKLQNLKNYWADLKAFQGNGGKLNIVPTHLGFVHHKFAIIDDWITITGSYNWSKNAINNKENIVIVEDKETAKKFNAYLREIIDSNYTDIINNNFCACSEPNCSGRIFNLRIVDVRSTTKYFQNEVYRIELCSENFEHITKVSENTESDFIGDLIEYECEQLDCELGEKEFKHKDNIYQRRIDSQIAWSFNSRLDVFVDQNSHDIMGVYKINRDMEGFDELNIVWEHDLIKPLLIVGWENEIIEKIDEI